MMVNQPFNPAVVGRGGAMPLSRPVVVLAFAALVSLALEFGFDEPPLPGWMLAIVQLLAVGAYVLSRVMGMVAARDRATAWRACRIDVICLAIIAFVCLFVELKRAAGSALDATTLYIVGMQVVLLGRLAVGGFRLNLALSKSRLHPARSLAVTFVALIVVGSLALALPKATTDELRQQENYSVPRHLLNCLFTATSATCVTGLTVYDTERDFTPFGQAILLVLIQAGGLGIMIFGSLFGLLAGRQLSLKYSLALQDAISYRTLGRLRTMVVFIFVSTFVIEAVGAAGLYSMWHDIESPSERLFHSVFHAVSAFCNAGFALHSDNLIPYARAWQVYVVLMPLIILGGLGFPVLLDCGLALRARVRRLVRRANSASNAVEPHRFSLHSRLVLITSGLLIVGATPAFFLFESANNRELAVNGTSTMAAASPLGRMADALFFSVTCRTAGFHSVDTSEDGLSPASHMLGAILMFVGGSPASTAGGVKTVALAVLLLGVWSTTRGRARVETKGRTIPEGVVRRAAVVVIVMFGAVSLVTLFLCLTEGVSLRSALFEAVSACGTVGLSTGLTPDLTVAGRIGIMVAMFAGRLGPLTMLIVLAGRNRSARYEYPEEQVGIG